MGNGMLSQEEIDALLSAQWIWMFRKMTDLP
jgi:hypothetical protein